MTRLESFLADREMEIAREIRPLEFAETAAPVGCADELATAVAEAISRAAYAVIHTPGQRAFAGHDQAFCDFREFPASLPGAENAPLSGAELIRARGAIA